MLKQFGVALIALVAENSAVWGSSPDSSVVQEKAGTDDPSSNRLFMMSTGTISRPHHFSVGWFELLIIQLGYTPTDFLQVNLSGTGGYFSAGAKVRLLAPAGPFKGLAVGGDLGYFPANPPEQRTLQFLTVATSVGYSWAEGHIAISHRPNDRSAFGPHSVFVQSGFSLQLADGEQGIKLMGEWWSTRGTEAGLQPIIGIVGFRVYSSSFTGELAVFTLPRICFGHCAGESGFTFFPYFSLVWFFADH